MDVDEIGTYLEHKGLSDDQIDDFFAHYGIPGMRWGVRRANRIDPRSQAGRERQYIKDTERAVKTKRRVATGAAYVGTRVVLSQIMKKRGLQPIKSAQIQTASVAGAALVNSIMRARGSEQLLYTT
jgi:hypothetical protein